MRFCWECALLFVYFLSNCCGFPSVNRTGLESMLSNNSEDLTFYIEGGYRPKNSTLSKYVVSIRIGPGNFGENHICGGSIISAKCILTAAHCVVYKNGAIASEKSITVAAGCPFRFDEKNTQQLRVKYINVHPGFQSFVNDIATLDLIDSIELDGTRAAILKLPVAPPVKGKICHVIGWGRLWYNGPMVNEVVQADLVIQNKKVCSDTYQHNFGQGMFCAKDNDDIEKDYCSGDSGGPFICDDSATGIVSLGLKCGGQHPGVYTDVFYFVDWVEYASHAPKILRIYYFHTLLPHLVMQLIRRW